MKLYNSRSGQVEELKPLKEGEISLYYCGPTLQGEPHIGHMLSAVVFDQLVRWFEYQGYSVKVIRNYTDIDDKILAKASDVMPWWEVAQKNKDIFDFIYRVLNVKPVSFAPLATAHIPEMIELTERLIEDGHAYAAEGNVYFDVKSWSEYGSLTHQNPENLESGEESERGKKNPLDFALWKAYKATEPEDSSWNTPWGKARPGWHLECSAMSEKYLGEQFDIHGGGLDLRFPHHENENAQSTAAGYPFANLWMHHGLVQMNSQKMSKSIGNIIGQSELGTDLELPSHLDIAFNSSDWMVVRYFLSTAHYRSNLDFSYEALNECKIALRRIEKFVKRANPSLQTNSFESGDIPDDFVQAMEEDLNVPLALSVVHESVKAGNVALDNGEADKAKRLGDQVASMMKILGMPVFSVRKDHQNSMALGYLVPFILEERSQARHDKNWQKADALRDLLNEAGIVVEDGADGASWHVEGK